MMRIKQVLRELGVGANYRGFSRTALAISLALEDEDRMASITKSIYYQVAMQTNCSWTAVERNVRTVVHRAWTCNPELLSEMAGYHLTEQPKASEFIDIVSNYLRRNSETMTEKRNHG